MFPDLILSSPLVRACETAEPLAKELTPGKEFVITERLAAGELRPKKLSRAVLEQATEMAVLVGHMPDLGEYAEWLLDAEDGSVGFEKAAAASVRTSSAKCSTSSVLFGDFSRKSSGTAEAASSQPTGLAWVNRTIGTGRAWIGQANSPSRRMVFTPMPSPFSATSS